MSEAEPSPEPIPDDEPWYCPSCDFPSPTRDALAAHLKGDCPEREHPVSPQVRRAYSSVRELLARWDSDDGWRKRSSDRQFEKGSSDRWKKCADELRVALGLNNA